MVCQRQGWQTVRQAVVAKWLYATSATCGLPASS